MLARQRWFILLLLALALTFIASPRVFATPGASETHTRRFVLDTSMLGKCAYTANPVNNPIPTLNNGPTLMVLSDNWRKATYFCGAGYLGLGEINHVNEVYNNAGAPAWFKWYRNGIGHFCAFEGLGSYQNFDPPVRITQIDYGDVHVSDTCGN